MAQRIDVPGMGIVEFPDDMGDDQIADAIKRNTQEQPVRFMEEPNAAERFLGNLKLPGFMDNLRGAAPWRAMQGMADPVVGAVQTVANMLPDSTGIPAAVNKRVAEHEGEYQASRKARGSDGMDAARITGNILSPVNAVIAAKLPVAATAGMRALQGAGVGAVGGATAPVADTDRGFWGQKAGQVGVGAVTGGVLAPVLGKVAEVAVRRLKIGRNVNARASTHDVDLAVGEALQEAGQSLDDIPPNQLATLRQQVTGALDNGQQLDASAVLRKSDFDALGIQPTLGQITRNPMQFARERNLRGVEGVGEPLTARFETQGNLLRGKLTGENAKDAFRAGTQLSESLKNTDDLLRRHVSGLYKEARASAGKDLDVPLQGLAQDVADISQRYGSYVPDAISKRFDQMGLMGNITPKMHGGGVKITGNQTRLFTLEDANSLLQDINKLDPRSTNPPVSSALSELRQSVRRAIEQADPQGGPFAPAVKAASDRFRLHDAVPALKASADGSVAPDDFVRRYVLNGKTNEVKGLADVLKKADPAAYQEARAQVADALKRGAFGENVAGDAPFSPTRYMATVRRIGVDKLGAFFSPEEVQQIMTVGRVGAYIHQSPNASAVSTSNSNVGVINALPAMLRIPGVSPLVALGNRAVNTVQNNAAVRSALAADVRPGQVPLNPTQQNWLAYILGIGGLGSGSALGGAVGQ